jgi:hypothetical protein
MTVLTFLKRGPPLSQYPHQCSPAATPPHPPPSLWNEVRIGARWRGSAPPYMGPREETNSSAQCPLLPADHSPPPLQLCCCPSPGDLLGVLGQWQLYQSHLIPYIPQRRKTSSIESHNEGKPSHLYPTMQKMLLYCIPQQQKPK